MKNALTLTAGSLRREIVSILPACVALRHELHAHPEYSFEEHWTAKRIMRFLEENGIPFTQGHAGGTGIAALIQGAAAGSRMVALRADMDALAIQEETGLPYASAIPGRMHACGHDGHMACLCGAAKLLHSLRDCLRGAVRLIFQPAEEQAGGGRRIVDEGLLEGVNAAFALHAWPAIPAGMAAINEGPVMAGADFFAIDVMGQGGHGADPAKAVDPIVAAAHIITALQCIVSRELNPWEPAVITIARLESGTASNIIPARARMEGGFRTLSPQVRAHILEAIPRIAAQTASAFRAEARFTLQSDGYPPLCNDSAMAAFARKVAEECFGAHAVTALPHPSMASEDFAFYLQKVPGAYIFLGNANPADKNPPPLHHPCFDFNDAVIPMGVELLSMLAIRQLQEATADS